MRHFNRRTHRLISRCKKCIIKLNKRSSLNICSVFLAPNLFATARMVRRKMCVKPMEENEDDKVVSMIVNYFSARVNIADDYQWKTETSAKSFAKSIQRVLNSLNNSLIKNYLFLISSVYKSIAIVISSFQNAPLIFKCYNEAFISSCVS